MADIKLYDTVKDKKGRRYRVVEVRGEGDDMVISVRGINGDGTKKGGRPVQRGIKAFVKEFTRINLPEVTVRKIDDLSEEERKMVKEPAPHTKAAEIEKEAVRALSVDEVEEALTKSTVGGEKLEPLDEDDIIIGQLEDDVKELKGENVRLKDTIADLRAINDEWAGGNHADYNVLAGENKQLKSDAEILKAELEDRVQECIDLKKTISKMQQAHEAEMQELKDQLVEAQAEAAAMRTAKERAVEDRMQMARDLDDDSVAMEQILQMATIMQRTAVSMCEVAEMIQAQTEGRI